uniref:Cytoplasmic dynein 1 heavy chain 1-like n=2 Tax=Cyanistes caeruleus TaxID=156563 RepID=A0A8C0U1N3_CYACU
MISKMLKMQMLEDEDDLAYAETEKKTRTDSTSDGRPAWMRTLHTTASNWLHLIPQTLNHLKRTVENIKDPLFRFFEREVKMGAKLLQDVRQDLADVVQVCEGKKKQTNYLRTLINELVKGMGIQISVSQGSLCFFHSVRGCCGKQLRKKTKNGRKMWIDFAI